MPVVTPPAINALPAAPDPNDRTTFNTRSYPWAAALATNVAEHNAVASNVAANATDAQTSAGNALTQANLAEADRIQTQADRVQTGLDRTAAANSAASAAAIAGAFVGTSTSSLLIATGAKSFTTQTGEQYTAGITMTAVSAANTANFMAGQVVSYSGSTLTINITATGGSGTFADWNLSLAGVQGPTGPTGGVSSVNGLTGTVTLALLQNVAYDNRATLRGLTPTAGDAAVVEGLGLFTWESASTEPDDDESSFATASGVWLLRAPSWDVVDSWQSPDEAAQDEDDEDEPLRFPDLFDPRFATSFATKVLTGSATCAIVSVAAVSSASFTGTVTGAAVGDRVIATPPAQLGISATETGKFGYHAWVSATATVTVMLTNASAASATTNTAIRAAWPITVIKT
jgi:hypothetical protein